MEALSFLYLILHCYDNFNTEPSDILQVLLKALGATFNDQETLQE